MKSKLSVQEKQNYNTHAIGLSEDVLQDLYGQQQTDLLFLKELIEKVLDSMPEEALASVVDQYNDALANCDSIDYQDRDTVLAYATLHLMDRYHRFQIMQREMLQHGLLAQYGKDSCEVLDVGAGPAPALMAFSDYYDWLSRYTKTRSPMAGDYVEQSQGFRQFLHHFVEYGMLHGKQYHIPFHFGNFDDFSMFLLQREVRDIWGRDKKQKFRYDIAIFSNFLTNEETITRFDASLKKVLMSLRNHGLVIIVGARSKASKKYRNIYDICQKIIMKKFRNRHYRGYWTCVLSNEFDVQYAADAQGRIVQAYHRDLVQRIKNHNLWSQLQPNVKKALESACEDHDRTQWEMVVYQKHVWRR